MDEKPHSDMDDKRALETLRDIALGLLEYNREDRAYGWGDRIYSVFKYLEERLQQTDTNAPPPANPQAYTESNENQEGAAMIEPETPEGRKVVLGEGVRVVNVFTGNVQSITIYNE